MNVTIGLFFALEKIFLYACIKNGWWNCLFSPVSDTCPDMSIQLQALALRIAFCGYFANTARFKELF